jgi:RNA polymerase sigma factor (TIGR02999 family)
MTPDRDITRLLIQWKDGSADALDQLLPLVYDELRALARSYLRRERREHTLQATALVHELFLRFAHEGRTDWQDRSHFFGIAARAMRQILVAHARQHSAQKRGGGVNHVALSDVPDPADPSVDLLALDTALASLADLDEMQARIVELRYFGGYTIDETAEILESSPATISREWQTARAWLYRELGGAGRDA